MNRSKPLSRTCFLEFFRGLLLRCGLEPPEAARAAYNRLRRFLPTGANCFQLDTTSAQAIGAWTEAPVSSVAGGSLPARLMSSHYAGEQVGRGIEAKRSVLLPLEKMVRQRQGSLLGSQDGLLRPGSLLWSEVACERDNQSPDLASGPTPDRRPEASQESSSSSSTTSASASSPECEAPEVQPDSEAVISLRWFQQGRDKRHIVHEVLDGRFVPYCRETPFHQGPSKSGVGVPTVARNVFCSKCLQRLPRGLQRGVLELLLQTDP